MSFLSSFETFSKLGNGPDSAAGAGAPGATFTEIWAGSTQIFDLLPANVTVVDGKASVLTGVGSDTDSTFNQTLADNRPTYSANDADFNQLPSLESSGDPIFMDARTVNNLLDKAQSTFIGASDGFMVAIVKVGTSSGNNATVRLNAHILGSSSAANDSEYGISHRGGADPKTMSAFCRDAGSPFTIRAAGAYSLSADQVLVVALSRTSDKIRLWIDGVMTHEGDAGAAYVADKMSIFKGENGAAGFFAGKLGPFASGTTVPADFADRLASTVALLTA